MFRGFVHEAVASEDEASAHLTVSTYQRWAWFDLMDRVLDTCNTVRTPPLHRCIFDRSAARLLSGARACSRMTCTPHCPSHCGKAYRGALCMTTASEPRSSRYAKPMLPQLLAPWMSAPSCPSAPPPSLQRLRNGCERLRLQYKTVAMWSRLSRGSSLASS